MKQLGSCLIILRGVTFRAQHLSLTSDADKIFKKFKYSQIYTGNDHEMQMAGEELDLFNLRRGRFAPIGRGVNLMGNLGDIDRLLSGPNFLLAKLAVLKHLRQ